VTGSSLKALASSRYIRRTGSRDYFSGYRCDDHRLLWHVWPDLELEVTVDFIFFGMTAASLFILRRRQVGSDTRHLPRARTPVHHDPVCLVLCRNCRSAIVASPGNSAIALCIMLAALRFIIVGADSDEATS
jgi:hypothetical protein